MILVNSSCSCTFILCLYDVIIRSYEETISFSEHVMSLLDMWAYVSGNNLTPGRLSSVLITRSCGLTSHLTDSSLNISN